VKAPPVGICKLTGNRGRFVKAHLIPRAVTRPQRRDRPFIQLGRGSAPIRRWSSWYDDHLVIQAGEDILKAFDTWAIPELRKHELVWSGWRSTGAPAWNNHYFFEGYGIRIIDGIDPRKLRLFFLSLLWRAAATDRPEFSEITLPSDHLETLRALLVSGNPGPMEFYPIQLIQLSEVGEVHNCAPVAFTKPSSLSDRAYHIPCFRFYFDDLIAHVHRQTSADECNAQLGSLGPLMVGGGDRLVVNTVSYEISFQQIALSSAKRWEWR
jgi:hypothetical protein